MTERRRIIIIGAGHNGLVCAAYLARAGRDVLVLEAAERVGGAAITREFAPGLRRVGLRTPRYLLDAHDQSRAQTGDPWPQVCAYQPAHGCAGRRGRAPGAQRCRSSKPASWRRPITTALARLSRPHAAFCAGAGQAAQPAPAAHCRRRPRGRDRRCACWVSISAGSGAIRCASSCASPASTSSTCSKRLFESPLLKGALALDAVLGTKLGAALEQFGAGAAAPSERRSDAAHPVACRCRQAAWARSAMRWRPAARASGATCAPAPRSSASRSTAIACPASSSKSGEQAVGRHRDLERRSRAHAAAAAWAQRISRPASCIASVISAPKAWPRSCTWRSTGLPDLRAAAGRAGRRAAADRARPRLHRTRLRSLEVRSAARPSRRWRSPFPPSTIARWRRRASTCCRRLCSTRPTIRAPAALTRAQRIS